LLKNTASSSTILFTCRVVNNDAGRVSLFYRELGIQSPHLDKKKSLTICLGGACVNESLGEWSIVHWLYTAIAKLLL